MKIDLETHEVANFNGAHMETPMDLDQANAKPRIGDTQWRGAGVPPTIWRGRVLFGSADGYV